MLRYFCSPSNSMSHTWSTWIFNIDMSVNKLTSSRQLCRHISANIRYHLVLAVRLVLAFDQVVILRQDLTVHLVLLLPRHVQAVISFDNSESGPCYHGRFVYYCMIRLHTHRTQFEIERRSCGQSMTNFRFLSCRGQNTFYILSFFFLLCLVRNLQKKCKKFPKSIQLLLCIRYCTDRLTL